jgi:hypothetical protein
MGNGSGPGKFSSNIGTNSWSYQAQRQFFNEYRKDQGNSFYGLSKPQYETTIKQYLANLGPGAGARARRFGRGGQSTFNSIDFKLY